MNSHFDPTGLIAGDYPLAHQAIILKVGQNFKRGAILGRISADDKYVLSRAAADDGSQTPVAVLVDDVDATVSDMQAPAYFSGEFAAEQCVYGEGHDADSVNAAFRKQAAPLFLRKVGAVA